MSRWREHLRIIALFINILFVVTLIMSRAWFVSPGLGLPIVVPPLLAVAALFALRG